MAQSLAGRGSGARAAKVEKLLREWVGRMCSLPEVRDWLDAGLTLDQSHLAWECVAEGLRPKDLAVQLDGVRAVSRLLSGESAAVVAARLQEQRRT